jgi:hypothetical protein
MFGLLVWKFFSNPEWNLPIRASAHLTVVNAFLAFSDLGLW